MKSHTLLLAASLAALSSTAARAQAPADFRFGDEVSAWVTGVQRADLERFERLGVSVEGVFGERARIHAPRAELFEDLLRAGFELIPIPAQADPAYQAAYRTHSQLTVELQAIAAANPGLCELQSIGDSFQGRALWCMKISDNPGVEEDEPEFRYISSMHGNEPVGMELCMELIHLLVDEYGTDPQITNLVDEVEIWILPLMNPDGYTNQSRYNAQGIDLNRDFPDRVVDPVNTVAGRATETQLVMNWSFGISPVLSGNFHTGALVVNYPYDSDPDPNTPYSATPDDAIIRVQSLAYSSLNPPMYASPWFSQGITNGIAWYLAYGTLQDWNYVWMGCNDVTIELSDSSWPPHSQIAGLWDDNRAAMLAYMEHGLKGVRGLVTDCTNGQPLAATVRVVGRDHDVYTDPDVGDYHRLLDVGLHSLEFSASGYRTHTVPSVGVGPGAATRLDVSLLPLDSITSYCTGKTTTQGCVPFLDAAGAGMPSTSDTNAFMIRGNDFTPGNGGILIYGFAKSSLGFHGGKLCIKSPTRTVAKTAKTVAAVACTGVASTGRLTRNFNDRIQSGIDPLLTCGQTVFAQWQQRDTGNTIGGFADALSNGLRFTVGP